MNQNNLNNMVPIAPAMNNDSNSSPKSIDIQRKKRTRAKRSCDMCRKKKTRCDADVNQPCTKCKLANVECEFLVEQKKRGPSAGSYVEILENRLLRMEKLLQNIAKKEQQEKGGGGEDSEECYISSSCISGPCTGLGSLPHDEEEDNSSGSDENDSAGVGQLEDFGPHVGCPTIQNHPTPEEEELNRIQQKMKLLTISDYQRTRYIGASSGVHFLNEELFKSKKKHRIPEEPSWFIQKLNDDEEEHVIMKTKEVPPPLNEAATEFQANRIGLFEDTPHMTVELADYLIHMYFARVHIYCPIINKTQFLEQYYFHKPTPPDKYMLNAIACIGTTLFKTEISLVQHLNFTVDQLQEMYVILKSKAHKLVSIVYKRSMISSVQTLMLLSMFVGHDDNDDEDTGHWFITGMAIRMAQDLGLHRDCSKWNIPPCEIELRKRIWYAAYLMDRWVAAELGRPVSILDNEFDVQLPTPYELPIPAEKKRSHNELTPILILEAEAALEEKKPVYIAFIHLVSLSQIGGQVLVGFHSTRAKRLRDQQDSLQLLCILDRNLTNWKMALPKELELDVHNVSSTFNAPACVVNMAYDCIWILLYRPFIKQHDIDQSADVNNMAFKALSICTASAINLISIVEVMDHHTFTALPWNMAVYAVFQAAIIFLHNAKGENTFIREQGRKYLHRCARVYNHDPYLRKTRMVKVLQRLAKQFEVNMDEDRFTTSTNSSQRSKSTTPTPPSIGHRRKRESGFSGGSGVEEGDVSTYQHSAYSPPTEVDNEEQARHNAFVKSIMTTNNVYLPTDAQKHVRTESGTYTVSRGNIDQGGRMTPDPYPGTTIHPFANTAPDDLFLSSLSGLGKMSTFFNVHNQDIQKTRKTQQEQEAVTAAIQAQQQTRTTTVDRQPLTCEEAAAAVARGELVLGTVLCESQQGCPNDSANLGAADALVSAYNNNNTSANSFSTGASNHTTPEADCCPSMNMNTNTTTSMNYNMQSQQATSVTDQTQQHQQFHSAPQQQQQQLQQQQEFDIASLQSDLPIWEVPSGVTWCAWEAFLKQNTGNATTPPAVDTATHIGSSTSGTGSGSGGCGN